MSMLKYGQSSTSNFSTTISSDKSCLIYLNFGKTISQSKY